MKYPLYAATPPPLSTSRSQNPPAKSAEKAKDIHTKSSKLQAEAPKQQDRSPLPHQSKSPLPGI